MITTTEKRTGLYLNPDTVTIPDEITPETSLDSLNLNWGEKDLPERVRTRHVHRLHPYLGKFIPQLTEVFLRKYFKQGQTVLDPFCGCGTTLVQASELGINTVGYDISAFNVLLCRAKMGVYDLAQVQKEVMDILEKTQLATGRDEQQLYLWDTDYNGETPLTKESRAYLQAWFAPQALNEILVYRHLIETEGYQYKDLLKVILSRSTRSARLTTHFDLDFPKKPQTEPYWCYKHSRTCTPIQEAFKFLRRYSIDTIRRIEEFSHVRTEATASVYHDDSREVVSPPIDGVITSPPYVGLIDYHEQHIYAYHLLGLEDKREREIGAGAGGSSRTAKQQYQESLIEVFGRAVAAMPEGGRLVVVANDKFNLYDGIAEAIGVTTEGIVRRHVNRRTGRRASEFYESIFLWRKK